jgi:LmbE family N-acetylglucosaminyl deacetylase
MKIAIVSAHRGDAGFGVGLSVGAWLAAGHSVEVIACCTRSEFAPFSDIGSVHANDRMSFATAVRKREDEAWLKLYAPVPGRGKLTLTDLNLKDAPLRLHVEADEVFGLEVNHAEKAFVKMQRAVERSRAEALVVPLALDRHVDRMTARSAALAGAAAEIPVAFYEDLPQGAMPGGDALVEQAVVSAAAGLPLVPVYAGEALDGDGVAGAVTRKRRLAWCYDSQIDEATTTLIAERCRVYAGREGLWGSAAWAASELNTVS